MPFSLRPHSSAAGSLLNDRDVARWIVVVPFGLIWLLFAVGNASIVFGLGKKPTVEGQGRSVVPFVGGLAGAVACLAAPYPLLSWAWVPLILDLGSLPILGMLAWAALRPRGKE